MAGVGWLLHKHCFPSSSDATSSSGHFGVPCLSSLTSRTFHIFLSLFFFPFLLATLGLRGCTRAFSSCGEWGLLSSYGVGASHCGGFSWPPGTQAAVVVNTRA